VLGLGLLLLEPLLLRLLLLLADSEVEEVLLGRELGL
jgi:hypothetical protein